MFALSGCLILVLAVGALAQNCPSGGEVYTRGISAQGRIDVINAHNGYRQQIMDGTVPGQPKGKNLKRMIFDVPLSNAGRTVSNTCKMEHIIAKDNRWGWVGQNLFISWSSQKVTSQDWVSAVRAWFDEHKNFVYPTTSNGVTGHYTQVVWDSSEFLGCDFIAFYDVNQPQYPHARLYTCNYGPGGNWQGQAPYQLA